MTSAQEMQTMEHAAELLRGEPWRWTVTIEYPGFLCVAFDNGDGTSRYYAAGYANPTLTVDQQNHDGSKVINGVDTGVRIEELDGYRFAIHTAAAIDRMEHMGVECRR